jgi:hypothetical protein
MPKHLSIVGCGGFGAAAAGAARRASAAAKELTIVAVVMTSLEFMGCTFANKQPLRAREASTRRLYLLAKQRTYFGVTVDIDRVTSV